MISPIPATCHCKVMVGGRVVKVPLPDIGHDWREGDEITDTCRGRREVVKLPIPVTCQCK